MNFKFAPVVVFTALTVFQSHAHAKATGWTAFTNLWNCENWTDSPTDRALADYERMSTPLPEGTFRKMVPFKESDLRTKPWIRGYQYVVVVNNSSPYLHKTDFPQQHPIPYSAAQLGLSKNSNYDQTDSALRFLSVYGAEAKKVYHFGSMVREKVDKKGNTKPVLSNLPQTQTVRVYENGRLIRIAKISTGRGIFELRDKNPRCSKRPDKSYYSVTEPGYYNFQELIKSGYASGEWDNADMPNAMFYLRGRGLALHEVNLPQKIATLGQRASGGCTRMDPNTASDLFDRINATQGATIPVVDVNGNPVLDATGRVTYKNRETIVFGADTSNEQRRQVKSFNALLIIQPNAVEDANPSQDQYVTFKYR